MKNKKILSKTDSFNLAELIKNLPENIIICNEKDNIFEVEIDGQKKFIVKQSPHIIHSSRQSASDYLKGLKL